MSLNIKDGAGASTALKTTLDAGDHIPHHIIEGAVSVTSSLSNPLAITGNITVNTASTIAISNFPTTQIVTSSYANPVYISINPVTTVSKSSKTSFSWNTSESGTFSLASENTSRKGLMIFNPGPYNLYISLASTSDSTNGFTLLNTASAPAAYSTILYPSGTYMADETTVGVYHGGYFISGSASLGVYVTNIQ